MLLALLGLACTQPSRLVIDARHHAETSQDTATPTDWIPSEQEL